MISTETCIDQFLDAYSHRLGKETLKNYESSVRHFVSFCEKPFNAVSSRDVRKWIIHLEEEGYKISTIKSVKMMGLRAFYKYCVEESFMACSPITTDTVPFPKDIDRIPHYLNNYQLAELRVLCGGNLKKRAIVEVLYTTGMRVGELTRMKLEDINWTERKIFIAKGKGDKERFTLFTKECGQYLNAYLQERHDSIPFVFLNRYGTGGINKSSIQHWFKEFREKLGVFVSPHTLRHTFAAHLAMKGMPLECIQVLLGHDSPENTHLYARLHQQAQKDSYDMWN